MDEKREFKARMAKQFGFALKDPNPNIRFLAIEGLQFLPEFPEAEKIVSLLGDPDRFVKWKAIQACGVHRLKSAVPILIKNLASLDLYTRSFSTISLGLIGDPSVLPHLIEVAKKESSPKVKQNIVRTVDNFLPVIPWDFLTSCSKDGDVGVRQDTAKTLGFLAKFGQASEILVNLLEKETDSHVFATAILALGRFKKDILMPYFQHSLLHQENRIRANAIEALGEYPFEVVEEIVKPYLKDPSNRVKGNVISIFCKNGMAGKVHWELQKLLSSPNRWERATGAWVSGAYRVTGNSDILIKLLGDEEAVVAERSAWALARIQAPQTFDALLKSYAKANQWALPNILKAMNGVARKSDSHKIQKVLEKERNPILKSLLVDLLASIDAIDAKPMVLKLITEGEHRIRTSVYEYLGKVDPENSATALFQGLSDPHHKVRGSCAEIMVKRGDFRGLKILSDLLNEKDKLEKVQATQTLRDLAERIRDPELKPARE